MVQGVNASGRSMLVQRIVEGVPRPAPLSAPSKLLQFHHSDLYQGGQPLRVLAASGPFTTMQNLDYEPFDELMQKVFSERPDVLILMGPFVDSAHPLMKDGDITLTDRDNESIIGDHLASYEMVFIERIIRDGLLALFNGENEDDLIPTHIILIPALGDAHHEFVFPQPPFADRDVQRIQTSFYEEAIGQLDVPFSRDSDPKKRVHLLPNPCMFRINEVLFGTTSFDTLFALSGDEVSQSVGNRLDRLASHVLQQQSFVPLFPTPPNCISQMDLSKSKHWQMKTSPDVLLLPSKLGHMAKDIAGTVIVNPGNLAKGSTGGTYAEILIHPMKEAELRAKVAANDEPIAHAIAERATVTIMKI